MTKSVHIKEMPVFDAALFLDDEESIAVFLNDVYASGDETLLKSAFADVARARGMTKVIPSEGESPRV